MKTANRVLRLFGALLLSGAPLLAQTPLSSPMLAGTLKLSESPYVVDGPRRVPDGATLEIEAGVEATCKKLYRRDYPEKPEWESLPRGVYTGDEATAVELGCFYEPGLFSGAGTLSVYRDDFVMPTIMILR